MSFDVAVLLWGALVTVIVIAGIVTGEWKEIRYYARGERQDEAK